MANLVGMKGLNQVSGSTDILYTDRRRFYLDENFSAKLWSSAAPFLNFTSQVSVLRNLNDPDYKM